MLKNFIFIVIVIMITSLTFAHEDNQLNKAEEIIKSGIPCNELTEEQFEVLGDYYMEKMHPGEAHEIMDRMMSNGDPERLRQMHIAMGKSIYCNDNYPEIPVMGGMMGMMNFGIPHSFMWGAMNYWALFWIILVVAIILLIFLIIYLIQGQKSKNTEEILKER